MNEMKNGYLFWWFSTQRYIVWHSSCDWLFRYVWMLERIHSWKLSSSSRKKGTEYDKINRQISIFSFLLFRIIHSFMHGLVYVPHNLKCQKYKCVCGNFFPFPQIEDSNHSSWVRVWQGEKKKFSFPF